MTKFTDEDDALLEELGVKAEVKKRFTLTAREERIIAGFEEIQQFVEEQGREPLFGETRDIFEKLYATRLEQIRRQEECINLLQDRDHQNLLSKSNITTTNLEEDMDDDELLAELGLNGNNQKNDITKLRHVKPRSEIRQSNEIGTRTVCKDFEIFKPLFLSVNDDLKSGARKTIPFGKDATVEKGNLFILAGQTVFIADIGETFVGTDGRDENRLRVIFDNGVESNQLLKSFKARLYEEKTSRRITDPNLGPLFGDNPTKDDIASGIIYVCRSHSTHPLVVNNKRVVHKIGVTTDIKTRLSKTEEQATFLFAKVDLVASFELYNIDRKKMESLLHTVFESARLEIQIMDRWNKPYHPKEWYCVSLDTIQDAVQKLKDGTLLDYRFNIETGLLEKRN